ncbi:endonuclease/exonuclease/phosphatase family protein [Nocardiopsis halophila]|uniref:endonuclease/exonuclease/phosphatase family protein n=1 Tax=Nocardiopsis halophila TaxID=141692 RepID=UPI000348DDB7|nr:endonuclease/exonuclease/phosphatase family protein [Nocardiopsis halophila]
MRGWWRRATASAAAAVAVLAGLSAPAQADTAGTLAPAGPVAQGEQARFAYSTPEPHDTNWIGVYPRGEGPVDEEYTEPSLAWSYAPEAEGEATVDTAALRAGDYTAYLLARDGYAWLADPVDFTVTDDRPVSFPTDGITLRNAREGDAYEASVGGLASGGGEVAFRKTGGPAWAAVAEDGTVTGTPDGDTDARIAIEAVGEDGSTAALTATVPVRKAGQDLVGELDVMTYNTWHAGTQVNGHHEKQLRYLIESGADIVGLQETEGEAAERLATALGWDHWQTSGSLGVISRYPITEERGTVNASGSVEVSLDGPDSRVAVWDAHLGYTPYGPYDACDSGMSVDRILEREAESGRTPQIEDTVAAMEEDLAAADEVPVLLMGDFNSPSHLDWTEELREKNCGYADVPWPASTVPTEAGLTDSFREAHPDPAAEPGTTWSPLFPKRDGDSGVDEPQDRIDFVYYKGPLAVERSQTLVAGEPEVYPNHADNEWTSDHASVMTTFSLGG